MVERTKLRYPPTYMPQDRPHEDYDCNRRLQAIEVVIDDASDLIEELYDHLYENG